MSLRHYLHRPRTLTAPEAVDLLQQGALMVDVRGYPEWRSSHVPGALHLPVGEIPARWEELPEDRLLITFCTGGIVSAAAANLLAEMGFESANLSRGLIEWRSIGGALVSGNTHD